MIFTKDIDCGSQRLQVALLTDIFIPFIPTSHLSVVFRPVSNVQHCWSFEMELVIRIYIITRLRVMKVKKIFGI